jgi:hypothetical protein
MKMCISVESNSEREMQMSNWSMPASQQECAAYAA